MKFLFHLFLLPFFVNSLGFDVFHIDTDSVEPGAFGGDEVENFAPRGRFQLRRPMQPKGSNPTGMMGGPKRRLQMNMNLQKQNMNMKKQRKVQQTVKPMVPVPATEAMPASSNDEGSRIGFDFVVAGFPKCGTTTLLKAFGSHSETDMAASEQCAIASPAQADAKVHKLLDSTLATLSQDPNMKRSFKCPTAMYNYKSIARMEKHSPDTKFIVGMRHPVKMLQSFYNYRITEIKERGLDEPIPALDEIIESGLPWKGVSMQSTRFELFLMQMGKTNVTPEQLNDLVGQHYDLAIKPTNFTVFLYTVDQLEDADPQRGETLRKTMQTYLGLEEPIQAFGHENQNHAVGKAAHKESIKICADKWAPARAKLVEQGKQTALWLRDHFIESEDVVVANKEHFLESLESWGVDPCVPAAEA